jgi:hypothetical protein
MELFFQDITLMLRLFDDAWMRKFKDEWNKDPYLASHLKQINFSSTIAYGFPDEESPRACIVVENGYITKAEKYKDQQLNWDLRAKENHWKEWLSREVGTTGIGLAYSTGKLKFIEGDYKAMIRNPKMSSPFIKSFSAMSRVQLEQTEAARAEMARGATNRVAAGSRK